ncbi:MAG: LacI family DNA-binding transcriptional regulator [Chloroflexi bacterium]|nr:LacI family DNA-binding transcriptional regulator [Chloroflexota bacterium]
MAVTLKDVADRAGVSIKTVSNVVNGHPAVSAKTRLRVQAVLEELDYHPNLSARHLRRSQVGVVALAIPDLSNAYFADIGNSVIAAARARGYTVLLDHTAGDRAQELLVANGLRPHLIDGVIVSPQGLEAHDLQSIRERVPIVLLGERLLDTPWDHIVIDNVAAARAAAFHLVSLGRRRVAAIGVPKDTVGETSRLRLRGFTEALTQAGLPVESDLLVPAAGIRRGDGSQGHRADGAYAMRRLLALATPPDAVFCFNDLLALGAIRALHDAGYRVPDDVAVIGFDDVEEGLYATPSLTTIAPSKEEIGQLAVSLLIDRIQGLRTGGPETVQPSFRLVVRESTVGALAKTVSGYPLIENSEADNERAVRDTASEPCRSDRR